MKRSLILLSLLAGPCLFCSYKAEAGTPTTAETLAEATVKKPVPAHIYNHFKEYSFFFTYKESDALRAGYEGNTAVLDILMVVNHKATLFCRRRFQRGSYFLSI